MLRIAEERTEVDDLFASVVELQAEAVAAHVLGIRNVDDALVHGSGWVIFSVETDLCSTK